MNGKIINSLAIFIFRLNIQIIHTDFKCVKWHSYFGKQFHTLKKLKIAVVIWSSHSTPRDTQSNSICLYKDSRQMFMEALFVVAWNFRQPNCFSIVYSMNKPANFMVAYYSTINELLIHAKTQKNLKINVLGEASQTRKCTCCMMTFRQLKLIQSDRKHISGCLGMMEPREG